MGHSRLTALLEDTYVDNIHGGGDVEEDTATFKEEAPNIMSEGGFTLHKWHSNVERLNSVEKVTEGEETYAVCAALYIVSFQDSTPVDQNLLAAKSRVEPKEMSTPRLELVAAHTLVKFKNNVS